MNVVEFNKVCVVILIKFIEKNIQDTETQSSMSNCGYLNTFNIFDELI
jgi:hypothetical protein